MEKSFPAGFTLPFPPILPQLLAYTEEVKGKELGE